MSSPKRLERIERLADRLAAARDKVDDLQAQRDQEMIDARFDGFSLADIGRAANLTRQGASKVMRQYYQKTYGRNIDDAPRVD